MSISARNYLPLVLLVGSTPAFAQENNSSDNTIVLDPVVVTGDWLDQPDQLKILRHPGARTVVDRKTFEEQGASNVRDVLRTIPGVQVQDSNGTGGSDVSLNVSVRGLTARLSPRSTIMIDGMPASYAPYGQPQLSLFPTSLGNIQSVDVVRGAGSVRYGPQNVGGIINFVTRPIPEQLTAEAGTMTEVSGPNGNIKMMPRFFVGGTNSNGFGAALLYSGTHGDGYRTSNDHSRIDDIMFKSSYKLSETDSFAFTAHHFEGKGQMPGGLTRAEYAADPFQSVRPYDEFTGRRSDVALKYLHNDGVNNLEIQTYYIDSFRGSYIEQGGEGANAGLRRLTAAPRSYKVFAIEPRFSRVFKWGDVSQEVTIGYRFLKEESAETASRSAYYNSRVFAKSLPQSIYQTSAGGTTAHAFYIDDKIEYGRWTLTPGVRYEHIDTFNGVTDFSNGSITNAERPKISASEILPTVSLGYMLTDQWNLFANVGVSFGPQQYSHLASTTDGLQPEKATTYELGTRYRGEGLSGELTLFNIDFDQELYLGRSIVGEGVWTNLGATLHRGVEAAARYDLGTLTPTLSGLSLSATYTYTEATYQAGAFEGRDLPFYSRHVGSLGARYQYKDWVFNTDVFMQSKQHSPGNVAEGAAYVTVEDASGRLGDIPSYATVNIGATYAPEIASGKFKLGFGVKNLFDKRYYTRSTDNNGGKFVGQPQTFYVNASAAF